MHIAPAFNLRLATRTDIPALHALIEASVRGLQAADYTPAQMRARWEPCSAGYATDRRPDILCRRMLLSQTRRAAHGRLRRMVQAQNALRSRSRTGTRARNLLDPATDAAKIRAIFVIPISRGADLDP